MSGSADKSICLWDLFEVGGILLDIIMLMASSVRRLARFSWVLQFSACQYLLVNSSQWLELPVARSILSISSAKLLCITGQTSTMSFSRSASHTVVTSSCNHVLLTNTLGDWFVTTGKDPAGKCRTVMVWALDAQEPLFQVLFSTDCP